MTAIADTKRLHILRCLGNSSASPKELTSATGIPLPLLAYHVRVMAKAGLLELVDQRGVRGAVEHFYRVTPAAAAEVHELASVAGATALALEALRGDANA